jgi:hypothetical protein
MKILSSLFLVPALLLGAPAARAQSLTFGQVQGKFHAATLEFRPTEILCRGPVFSYAKPKAFEVERNAGTEPFWSGIDPARARMEIAFEVLQAHAARWQLYYEDVEEFVEAAVAENLRAELAALEAQLGGSKVVSREKYEMMVSLIQRIAAHTLELVQAPNMRARLAGLLPEMIDSTRRGVLCQAQVQDLKSLVGAAGIVRSKQRLEKRAADGRLLAIDIQVHALRVHKGSGF